MIDELAFTRYTGLAALLLLVTSLTASLHPRTRIHRRKLGLAAAALALLHAAFTLYTPLVEDLRHLIYEPHLRAGATALVVLSTLAATSFPKLLRVRNWEALHAAVYAAALLALHHLWLSSHARRFELYAFSAAIALVFTLRVLRGMKRHNPLAKRPAQRGPPPPNTPDPR